MPSFAGLPAKSVTSALNLPTHGFDLKSQISTPSTCHEPLALTKGGVSQRVHPISDRHRDGLIFFRCGRALKGLLSCQNENPPRSSHRVYRCQICGGKVSITCTESLAVATLPATSLTDAVTTNRPVSKAREIRIGQLPQRPFTTVVLKRQHFARLIRHRDGNRLSLFDKKRRDQTDRWAVTFSCIEQRITA